MSKKVSVDKLHGLKRKISSSAETEMSSTFDTLCVIQVWIGINSFLISACTVTFLVRVTSTETRIGPVKSLAVALYLMLNVYFVASVCSLHRMIKRQRALQRQILGNDESKYREFTPYHA